MSQLRRKRGKDMSVRIKDLNIPDTLYNRLKERAEQHHRTVEDELVEAAAAGIAEGGEADNASDELDKMLASMTFLPDEALWQAGRSHLPLEMWEEIDALHLKRQREGLMKGEEEQLSWLMRQYERAMLIRAEAAALLKERGYNIDELRKRP